MSAELTGTRDERKGFTLREVAATYGLSLRSLQDGCRAGRIRATKWNQQWVMTEEQIKEFFASHEVKPQTSTEDDELAEYKAKVSARLARQRGAAA